MAIGLTTAVKNARLSAIATAAGASPKIRIYSGTRPTTGGAETAILAELTMPTTPFGTPANGIMNANAIPSANAKATGTATWFRLLAGTTPVMDGSVGEDLALNATAISSGQLINITSFTVTEGN